MLNGFTFPMGRKDIFVATERRNKTVGLAKEICCYFGIPDGRAKELLYWLSKATCETITIPDGRKMYKIRKYHEGKDAGCIIDLVENGSTEIIRLV